ncbi:MAG: tRNA dihydrouridine synthase DusB [Planctomycetota bacterium]|nr:MAG: tRNA dihydrouridine synthase DusB [Planctomycetota bacterium]
MRIGKVEIDSPVVGAPMAGASSSPYRRIIRRMGACIVYTEMIKAKSILMRNKKTLLMSKSTEDEHPLAIQICGRNPDEMAAAGREMEAAGADVIDINFGCPVRKVTRLGEGAVLMGEPEMCEKIVRAAAKAVGIPVTIKMRSGWDESSITAPEIARRAEDAGAAAVCIHARTQTQMYSGAPNLDLIRKVKDSVSIPVIGNGGIQTVLDVEKMINETGCDMVMIGRAALGYPWIFREAKTYLQTGEIPPPPTFGELRDLMLEHYAAMCNFYDERTATMRMRKFTTWYSKGIPGARKLRVAVFKIEKREELEEKIREHFAEISGQSFNRRGT